ncbi:spore germination protein GerPC [Bacillus sp. FJAT-50079]|uniref:spore germination protein GerPC n=1 Tax=Bacillus sp. FJAT-50079 TaxID=2833577 RepID=UPI001BC955CC|nr:hypothetical protein [Bacillus sp. FJAT-50079]
MDVQYCIQQLYEYVNQQHYELAKLRKEVDRLENEVKKLKDKPGITVERLEYKFDQLKVETLEGTLNIGLNPADLKQIEDVAIPTPSQPPSPVKFNEEQKEILTSRLNDYIENDVKSVIHETEKQTGIKLAPQHIAMIQDDIRKQLPTRTEHYIQFFSHQKDKDRSEEQLGERLYRTIVADIDQAVRAFIIQTANNEKGKGYNGT